MATSSPTATPTLNPALCGTTIGLSECQVDADCVVVNQIGRCPCNIFSGVWSQGAINRSKQLELEDRVGECYGDALLEGYCCDVPYCDGAECPDVVAVCAHESCTLVTATPMPTARPVPSPSPTATLGVGTVLPSPTTKATPPPGGCETDNDCDIRFEICFPRPDGVILCGPPPAPIHYCFNDFDCGDSGICIYENGCLFGYTCAPGCFSDADCQADQSCTASRRCLPRPCAADADCPQLFSCQQLSDSGSLGCLRRHCGTDADCLEGFCVNGECRPELGMCEPIPA
jgi:hypothetical protein